MRFKQRTSIYAPRLDKEGRERYSIRVDDGGEAKSLKELEVEAIIRSLHRWEESARALKSWGSQGAPLLTKLLITN